VNETLRGFDVRNQVAIDETLVKLDGTENKSRIGGNVTIATSIAALHAGAKATEQELFRYIGGSRVRHIPVPLLNVINGGKHAGNELKIQEFIIIPYGFSRFADAIEASTRVYRTLKSLITERYGKLYTAVGDEGRLLATPEANEGCLRSLNGGDQEVRVHGPRVQVGARRGIKRVLQRG
jgi:enolase (EC 4.2.1.11)